MSVVYWFFDSSVHWLVYGETFQFIPDDFDELWMRALLVTTLLIFGLYVDKKTAQLKAKEREKQYIFGATVTSTQHILNNLLNQVVYIKLLLEENDIQDEEIHQQLDSILKTGTEQVNALSEVDDISEETIRQSVYPKA